MNGSGGSPATVTAGQSGILAAVDDEWLIADVRLGMPGPEMQ
jgi:hypothetical protein